MDIDYSSTFSCTGHRPSRLNYYKKGLKEYIEQSVEAEIKILDELGYNTFLFGGCSGFDLLCAETVIKNRNRQNGKTIKIICALPYSNFKNSKWFNKNWKTKYDEVIKHCDNIIVVGEQEDYFKGCYQKRNRWLVSNSNIVIAFYDGLKTGGTYNTIMYAQERGRQVHTIVANIE